MRKYKFTIIVSVCILIMLLMPVSQVASEITIPYLDKVVHFCIFGFLTCVFFLEQCIYNKKICTGMSPVFFIGGYAIMTEIFQKMVRYRSFDVLDIVADFTGILIAYAVICCVRQIIK